MNWTVTAEESGLSLHNFLSQKVGTQLSGKALKRLLEKGCCQLNGRLERFPNTLVGRGDRIALQASAAPTTPSKGLHLIWSDRDFMAVDKPAGMNSEDVPAKLHPHAALAHRLDRDTTGVLLLGKTKQAAEALQELFRKRQVDKEYIAVVDGLLKPKSGEVKNFLGKKAIYHGQAIMGAVCQTEGLAAVTQWEVLQYGKEATHIKCMPQTGRTHQLRVHMAEQGHPILGDPIYGKQYTCTYRPNRCMLHCREMRFVHPKTAKEIVVTAELPSDITATLMALFGKLA